MCEFSLRFLVDFRWEIAVKVEGAAGLYKGLGPSLASIIP